MTSEVLARIRPMAGLTNPDQPMPTIFLDCPDRETAREINRLIMAYQTGYQTMTTAPVYFGDTAQAVGAYERRDGSVLLSVFPHSDPAELTLGFCAAAEADPDGWEMFQTYYHARRQFYLSTSVGQRAPQELPTLVKYQLIHHRASGR